jgi:hypothetical protein
MENIKRVLTALQQRHSNFFLKNYLQVMLGLALSLMAPVALFFFFFVLSWCWGKVLPVGWGILIATAVVWPFLYRFEIQAQGGLGREITDEFIAAEQEKKTPPSFKHLGTLGMALSRQRPPMSGLLQVFLIGPQMVVSSVRKLRIRRLSEKASIDRIIAVCEILLKIQGGAATEKLLEAKETPAQLSEVLAYLLFFEWIGVATDGTKVWMLTEAKKVLGPVEAEKAGARKK